MNEITVYVIFLFLFVIGVVLSYLFGKKQGTQSEKKEQMLAKQTATDLLEQARAQIQNEQKVALLETKEKIRSMEEAKNKEFAATQTRLTNNENEIKIMQKELVIRKEMLDKQDAVINRSVEVLKQKQDELANEIIKHEKAMEERVLELAKLTEADAREIVLADARKEVEADIANYIREQRAKAEYKVKQRSKSLLVQAMQKYSAEVATERTVSVVTLSNDELKGRLIGREGRNIRSIEMLTGVDVIIDDTPEAVVLSCFDPIRRELARMTVQELVDDGRIHPGRIEEIYNQKAVELDQILLELGEQTLIEMNLPDELDKELLQLIGRLHYRTSYGQNILQHSKEVGYIAGILATELGEDVATARLAGLLHDIGKAIDFETEGTHIELGVKIAKKFRLSKTVLNAIASHHGDTPPTSIISELVAIADSLSATRPGARRESFDSYIKRLTDLENTATSFAGVQKAYAIQAGREIRVLVNPEALNDDEIVVLSHDLKKQIEENLQYPGTIKVTVIRELRAVDIAK